jgi:hypothetical protein
VADRRPITTAPPSGDAGGVRLTRGQLLINQRIHQVALLRARALAGRPGGRLTGGDLDDGTLTRGRPTPALALTATGAAPSAPASSARARIPDIGRGEKVRLSAAQAGIGVANDAVRQIERSLVNDNFLDRVIGADARAPGVITGP